MKNIFKVDGKFKIIPLLVGIMIPLLGGLIVGFLIKDSASIYESLIKPNASPDGRIFKVVWPILYILMGIASYRVYVKLKNEKKDIKPLIIYLIQLLVNFSWSFIFFTLRLYGISAIVLFILIVLIIITIIKFYKIDKASGLLLTPYLLWSLFAFYLNLFIWILNEM